MAEGYDLTNILANLAARIGALEGSLKTFMDNWQQQDRLAHDARRVTYDKIDLVGKQIERVSTDLQNVQQDVAELKKEIDEQIMPHIDADMDAAARRAGAKSVWALIGAGVVMVASALAYIADKVASYFVAKP